MPPSPITTAFAATSPPRCPMSGLQDTRDEDEFLFDEIVESVPEEMAGDVDLINLDETDKKNLKSVPRLPIGWAR